MEVLKKPLSHIKMLPGSTFLEGSSVLILNISDTWSDEETVTEDKFVAKIDYEVDIHSGLCKFHAIR
jgi:hypothetical protein